MNKKYYSVILIVGILSLSGAVALTITALTAEQINLFGGSVQDTDFTVSSIETQFKGKNKIVLDLTISNIDTGGHSANITIQLLDSAGDLLIEDSVLTGIVPPSSDYLYSNNFVLAGLVASYDSNMIVIKQID